MAWSNLLSLVIATVAVALSLVTVLSQKRQQQREAYRGIYETLTSQDLHRGRWLLIEISRTSRLPEELSPDFLLINRTLGWFDTLAMYVQRRVVPRRWVLGVWHHPLRDMRTGALVVARDHLARQQGWAPWPHLWPLLDQAVRYRSSLPCCQPRDLATLTDDPSRLSVPGQAADPGRRQPRSAEAGPGRCMTGITLRPATPADSEFCFHLHKAAMGGYITAIWGWDEQRQRGFHTRGFDPGRWQIITAGGADIGMLDVEYRPAEIYLPRIEVHPGHQGRGIGTRLISALIDEAAQKGQDLVLDVLTVNTRPGPLPAPRHDGGSQARPRQHQDHHAVRPAAPGRSSHHMTTGPNKALRTDGCAPGAAEESVLQARISRAATEFPGRGKGRSMTYRLSVMDLV